MSDQQNSQGILQDLGVESITGHPHGINGKQFLVGIMVAATLASSLGFSGNSYAQQAERAAATAQATASVQSEMKSYDMKAVGPDGVTITLSSPKAQVNAEYQAQAQQEINRSIDMFNKTGSWDMVMAEIVAPGLKSQDATVRLAAQAVQSFYVRSAEQAASRDGVTPISQSGAAYFATYQQEITKDYAAAKAVDTLEQAVMQIDAPGQVTPAMVDAQLGKMGAPSFDEISKNLADSVSSPLEQVALFQEAKLSLQNQAEQYRNGGGYEPSPQVKAAEIAAVEKIDQMMILEYYRGSKDQFSKDMDSLVSGKDRGAETAANNFQISDYAKTMVSGRTGDFGKNPILEMRDDAVGWGTPRG